MTDPEGDEYYRRKQFRAEETAILFLKVSFYCILLAVSFSIGAWIVTIMDWIWG